MKIAILYIATGKYICFWQGFYESCERYFLPGTDKHYIVFTDAPEVPGENVEIIYKQQEGFPADSLFRFDMFLSVKDRLSGYDHLFFFNANMLFVDVVDKDFLPGPQDHFLCGVLHPADGLKHLPCCFFFYERNRKSLAFIPPFQKDYHYFMGGINGGRRDEFLQMCSILSANIHNDYDRGIVAKFHDESHLNCYFRKITPKILGSEYGFPEGWKYRIKPKIMIRDKVKVSEFFRKQPRGAWGLIRAILEEFWWACRWYLG